jgi:Zn-dependent protease with chaperone function
MLGLHASQTMRKYREYQEQARELTAGLCALLAVGVVGTIVFSSVALAGLAVLGSRAYLSATTNVKMPAAHWYQMYLDRLRAAGALTTLVIVGTALYKSYKLAEGGGGRAVAKLLGGTRVSDQDDDPQRRRLRSVVEELAIATGLPTPPAYVLDDESDINAFAAGYRLPDAVIGVTRGGIARLQRHQLQGVVAHEFSHIINGDMRLNVRLLGILTGIQAISFVARYLIRLGMPRSLSIGRASGGGKHPLGMALALVFGVCLWPIGLIGSVFAQLITAAVNRQREFLADASAVQITRDPDGLREALIVIVKEEAGSHLNSVAAQMASHMFFAASGRWQRLFRTHPSLEERIRRLDPSHTVLAPESLLEARSGAPANSQ